MERRARKPRRQVGTPDDRLYTLEVSLLGGPVTSEFAKANPVVSRTIQIRGRHSLAQLHRAIFVAYDREEEHMYEFQIGGKGPYDPTARCYVLPMAMQDPFGDAKPAGDVMTTRLDSLGLKTGDAFGYWFDFGDDWWHQITVTAIEEGTPPGRYPRVTGRVGASPPQYPDWDDEEA